MTRRADSRGGRTGTWRRRRREPLISFDEDGQVYGQQEEEEDSDEIHGFSEGPAETTTSASPHNISTIADDTTYVFPTPDVLLAELYQRIYIKFPYPSHHPRRDKTKSRHPNTVTKRGFISNDQTSRSLKARTKFTQ